MLHRITRFKIMDCLMKDFFSMSYHLYFYNDLEMMLGEGVRDLNQRSGRSV